jgi:hypothetical protein
MGTPDQQHGAAPSGEVVGPRASDPAGIPTTTADAKGPEMEALSKAVADIKIRQDTTTDAEVEDEPPTRELPDDETVKRRQEVIDRIMRSFRTTLEAKVGEAKPSTPELSKEMAAMELKADEEEEGVRVVTMLVEDDEHQHDGTAVSAMATEPPPPPPAKAVKKSISVFSRFMPRKSVAESSASSSPSPPPPPPGAAAPPIAAPAPKEEAKKRVARSSSTEKEKSAPAELRSTDRLAAAVPVLKQKRAVPPPRPPPPSAPAPAVAPVPGGGLSSLFSRVSSSQAPAFSTLLPQPQLQAFGAAPPAIQSESVQPEPPAPPAPLSTLSAASSRAGAGLRRREFQPAPEPEAQEPPPPRLSSFRQTAVPPAVPPVHSRRRAFVVPDAPPQEAFASIGPRGFGAESWQPSNVPPNMEPGPAPQAQFETLDFYSDINLGALNNIGLQSQTIPSYPGPHPTGAAAEEASLEYLRDILPPGAFSGLGPTANLQGSLQGPPMVGLEALGGTPFNSHVFMPSTASYGPMAGPSTQVISPISLSDASERQGLSPEAPRTKHEQEDDGAIASDHDGRRKKPKRTAADKVGAGGPGKKFACPYFKRNRAKYSKWTSCPGPGWDEVHRVK